MPLPLAAAAPDDMGWLYDLLRWMGVDETTASHVQHVIVKPVGVVLVLVVAALVGWAGNRVIRRWIGGAVRKAAARADSPRAERRAVTLTHMVANIWRIIVAVVAVLVALGTVGIDLTPLLAGATIIGAAIGFGAQRIILDVLAGFLLTVEGQYDIGDTITIGASPPGITGVVEDLTLRVTRLRAADGAVWYVANGDIRAASNTTRGWALATVDVMVPSGAGLAVVLQALDDAADTLYAEPELAALCSDKPTPVGVVASTAENVTVRVTARTTALGRDRLERALRSGILGKLQGAGVFGGT